MLHGCIVLYILYKINTDFFMEMFQVINRFVYPLE